MVKFNFSKKIVNSPKQRFLADFNKAFAENDTQFILDHMTEDAIWFMVGDQRIQGKKNMEALLTDMSKRPMDTMTLETIITHGKEAAVTGYIKMPDGKTYAFCDVYEFTSHSSLLLKSIISYVIATS